MDGRGRAAWAGQWGRGWLLWGAFPRKSSVPCMRVSESHLQRNGLPPPTLHRSHFKCELPGVVSLWPYQQRPLCVESQPTSTRAARAITSQLLQEGQVAQESQPVPGPESREEH